MKSIWKCRPPGGRHFDVGFINQALLAKVSLLDKVSFCGTVKPQPRPENPTDTMKKMSIMANPIMSGDSLVFLTTAHNRAMSSHVQNRLSTDTCETHRYERVGTWFKLPEYIYEVGPLRIEPSWPKRLKRQSEIRVRVRESESQDLNKDYLLCIRMRESMHSCVRLLPVRALAYWLLAWLNSLELIIY